MTVLLTLTLKMRDRFLYA